MKWAIPLYNSSQIDRAGIALANGSSSDADLEVINNWRSSHSFPLQIIKMMLKGRVRKADASKGLVSQSLKRMTSIRAKTARESIRLSQMQDVGGCRAVMSNIAAVERLIFFFKEGIGKNPKGRHLHKEPRDYIANPKPDGYRGVHYIVRYQTQSKERGIYNGKKIEIQIRTRLQHAWATALETVDALTGRSLKFDVRSNIEDPRWKRFFALMGSAIALREKRPRVPNTPESKDELTKELRELTDALHVEEVLKSVAVVVNYSGTEAEKKTADEYILVLDTDKKTVNVLPFTDNERTNADARYLQEEKAGRDKTNVQVVRVSVEDINTLKTAYPNYYLDTQAFISALRWSILEL